MPKLLIIKPSSLGDIIHALQVVEVLKKEKDYTIHWVARELFAPLVKSACSVSKVYIFERKGNLRAFFQLLKALREEEYDQVWDMQGLARSGIMTLACKSPTKIGRPDAREGARYAYKQTVAYDAAKPHAIDQLLPFLSFANTSIPSQLPKLHFKNTAKLHPDIHKVMQASPILLFPESRRKEKMWPKYAELTSALCEKFPDKHFAWMGQTRMLEPQIKKGQFQTLMGRVPIDALPALIESASLVICNDSGPMHIAAALHTPVVALFGPTSSEHYGPYPTHKKQNRILSSKTSNINDLDFDSVLKCCVESIHSIV